MEAEMTALIHHHAFQQVLDAAPLPCNQLGRQRSLGFGRGPNITIKLSRGPGLMQFPG